MGEAYLSTCRMGTRRFPSRMGQEKWGSKPPTHIRKTLTEFLMAGKQKTSRYVEATLRKLGKPRNGRISEIISIAPLKFVCGRRVSDP